MSPNRVPPTCCVLMSHRRSLHRGVPRLCPLPSHRGRSSTRARPRAQLGVCSSISPAVRSLTSCSLTSCSGCTPETSTPLPPAAVQPSKHLPIHHHPSPHPRAEAAS